MPPRFLRARAHATPRADRPGARTLRATRRNVRRTLSGSLLATLTTTSIAGCGRAQELHSSAAPPTVICGTTLNNTPASAGVTDATRQPATITTPSVRGLLFIKVSTDCTRGARVSWTPAAAAKLIQEARTSDGLDAAVVLQPATPSAAFTLTAERNGRLTAYVTVHLTSR